MAFPLEDRDGAKTTTAAAAAAVVTDLGSPVRYVTFDRVYSTTSPFSISKKVTANKVVLGLRAVEKGVKADQNHREEIKNDFSITVSPRSSVEESLSIGIRNRTENRRLGSGVGVRIAEVEYRRKVTATPTATWSEVNGETLVVSVSDHRRDDRDCDSEEQDHREHLQYGL